MLRALLRKKPVERICCCSSANIRLGEGGRVGIARKQGGRDQVDPLVGTLGGEDGGDKELQRIGEGESAMGIGIEPGKFPDQTTRAVA